jgi:hypothetical protein
MPTALIYQPVTLFPDKKMQKSSPSTLERSTARTHRVRPFAVLELIKQREVRLDLDGEPTAAEIAKAVKALKVSGPGCTGVSAAEWKALLSDDETTAWVGGVCAALLELQGATG